MPASLFLVPRFVPGCLLSALLLVSLSAHVSAAPQADSPTDGNDLVANAEIDGATAAADSADKSKPAERLGQPEWIKSADEWFGQYLVGPIANVLFFDFWTGPRYQETTDETGKDVKRMTSEGWLKTKLHPEGYSVPFVVIWLLAGGIFLTLRMGFINVRAFRHAIDLTRGVYDNPDEPGEVTHFQALSTALSATVGLGNIAGVAIAIGTGGPGASFWILLVGLFGMSAKFAECTLGQLYRVTDADGHVLGGPMRYLRVGLKEMGLGPLGNVLAGMFMILCIGASFGGGNAFQVGQSLDAIRGSEGLLAEQPWIYGLIMAVAVGVVIIGGIKSIGAVASKIVPVMCLLYVVAALYILARNFGEIPAAISLILHEAFTPNAAYGGFLGVMVIGIKRAVFSNEAGIGSAAIAHSAAKTDEPVSEGIVALLEPFIDTVVVCSITALVVVVTGVCQDPEMASVIANKEGARLTLQAFVTGGHDWFRYILYFAVVLFAYSTCISWSYYGERCWVQLFGTRTSMMYKLLFLVFTFLGSIITRGNILEFSDLMILGMSLPNLLGVFLLSGVVKRALDTYWAKYKSGELDRTDRVA